MTSLWPTSPPVRLSIESCQRTAYGETDKRTPVRQPHYVRLSVLVSVHSLLTARSTISPSTHLYASYSDGIGAPLTFGDLAGWRKPARSGRNDHERIFPEAPSPSSWHKPHQTDQAVQPQDPTFSFREDGKRRHQLRCAAQSYVEPSRAPPIFKDLAGWRKPARSGRAILPAPKCTPARSGTPHWGQSRRRPASRRSGDIAPARRAPAAGRWETGCNRKQLRPL
jgi:hypothetical protein